MKHENSSIISLYMRNIRNIEISLVFAPHHLFLRSKYFKNSTQGWVQLRVKIQYRPTPTITQGHLMTFCQLRNRNSTNFTGSLINVHKLHLQPKRWLDEHHSIWNVKRRVKRDKRFDKRFVSLKAYWIQVFYREPDTKSNHIANLTAIRTCSQ